MSEDIKYTVHAVDAMGGGTTYLHLSFEDATRIMEALRPGCATVEMKREKKCG